MERKTEIDNAARIDEIKRFWSGFQSWKCQNFILEATICLQISDIILRNGYSLQEEKTEIGLETAMLFLYGVELAKKLETPFTDDVPVPHFEIKEDAEDYSYKRTAVYSVDNWQIEDSYFEIAFWHIVYPQYRAFSHVNFLGGNTKTVSEHLPDWVIVDNVITGAEEYAHELLRKKSPDKIRKLHEEIDDKTGLAESPNNEKELRLAYHAQTIERRAMVWQNRILNKYFPHWSEPFQKFTDEVTKRRTSDLRKKR